MTIVKWILIIGNALLVLAWPAGYLLGLQSMKSTDPAGRGYAQLFTMAAVLLASYIPVSIVFIVTGIKYWSQMSGWYKFFLLSPAWIVAGFLVVAVVMGIFIALD